MVYCITIVAASSNCGREGRSRKKPENTMVGSKYISMTSSNSVPVKRLFVGMGLNGATVVCGLIEMTY